MRLYANTLNVQTAISIYMSKIVKVWSAMSPCFDNCNVSICQPDTFSLVPRLNVFGCDCGVSDWSRSLEVVGPHAAGFGCWRRDTSCKGRYREVAKLRKHGRKWKNMEEMNLLKQNHEWKEWQEIRKFLWTWINKNKHVSITSHGDVFRLYVTAWLILQRNCKNNNSSSNRTIMMISTRMILVVQLIWSAGMTQGM